MSNPAVPENPTHAQPEIPAEESFSSLLSEHERSRPRRQPESGNQIEATVIAVSSDAVFLDIGYKVEGMLPLAEAQKSGESVKPGDKMIVAVKGRDPETGYYLVSRFKVVLPTDWSSLERAFQEKSTIVGKVTGLVKGGFNVDVGVRAFMPASRSGVREAADMEKLVEQEIRCRIIKLDVADEDVVVDRRIVMEEEERSTRERRYSEIKEGDVVRGEVRSLADYGAFVDIGGVDGLLHVGEIAWQRISKPADVLTVGQQIEAKVLKFDPAQRRISLSMKQLQPHPWESIGDRYKPGDRVRGVVTRVMEFGAFVEVEPGIEGLIHVSEMSWAKKVRIASDIVKPGDTVDVVVLGVNLAEHRLSLGLKQALGDPWADAARLLGPGSVVEGPISSMTSFGAFVRINEGVEGMIHVSEISAEKRIAHPRDAFRLGQIVKAQVLSLDKEKRQLRLSVRQLVPSSLDEYVTERKPGDVVSGRVLDVSGDRAKVELGEGVIATCTLKSNESSATETQSQGADLSALTSMLSARWKGTGPVAKSSSSGAQAAAPGQVRSFKIVTIDPESKRIDLEFAP